MSVAAIIACAAGGWILFVLFFVGLARAAAYGDDLARDDAANAQLAELPLGHSRYRRPAA